MSTLIFDYGGTLDTDGRHWGMVLWHAFERHGVPVTLEQFRAAYVAAERTMGGKAVIAHGFGEPVVLPADTFRETLRKKLSLEFQYLTTQGLLAASPAEVQEWQEELLRELYAQTQATTRRARQVLDELRRQGHRLALVSNFYGNLQAVLREFGLHDCFEVIVESAQVGLRKPDPAIFQHALKCLALLPPNSSKFKVQNLKFEPQNSLKFKVQSSKIEDRSSKIEVIGDSLKNDIRPAHQLGCRTVWLRGEGWDPAPDAPPEADRTITSLAQLIGTPEHRAQTFSDSDTE